MNLLVVCKPNMWPKMEPYIARLAPNVVAHWAVGQHARDFDLSSMSKVRPTALLGGCDETHDVLQSLCVSGDIARLRWIHSYNVGVDGLNLPALADYLVGIPISNARAASSHLLAEHVALSVLYFNRHVAQRQADHAARRWNVVFPTHCRGQVVGVLGYGDIGRAVAQMLVRAFQMRVLGYKRHGVGCDVDEYGARIDVGHDELDRVVTQSDFIVNCLPKTPETDNFMDAKKFAKMKPSAVFINIGRGSTVVEDDLFAALQAGTIRGAALDVFREEPLPAASPLWSLGPDKVLITAHDASPNFHCGGTDAAMSQFAEYATSFVCDGTLPRYLVDPKKGY